MMSQKPDPSRFAAFEASPNARARLFCFPYAGGGATVFRTWRSGLPAGIDLCPVQLPGRENRLHEPPFTSIGPLVEALEEALQPYMNVPFAFFGYSLGALIAFEFARLLRRRGAAEPLRLFTAAAQAPHLSRPPPISNLPDDVFIEALSRRYEGMQQEVLTDPSLMKLFLPALRADFTLLDGYTYAPAPPLNCPITALGGTRDHVIDPQRIRAWAVHTLAEFKIRMLPGGHFFLNSDRGLLLRAVALDLGQLASECSGRPDCRTGVDVRRET
jgi:medium-chain acyl-[acyl-carrier-protein] hydrolase